MVPEGKISDGMEAAEHLPTKRFLASTLAARLRAGEKRGRGYSQTPEAAFACRDYAVHLRTIAECQRLNMLGKRSTQRVSTEHLTSAEGLASYPLGVHVLTQKCNKTIRPQSCRFQSR